MTFKKAKFLLLAVLVTAMSLSEVHGQKKRRDDDGHGGLKLREAEFYFTEAEKYYILEDYAKALIYYQRAMESNPENPTIHYRVADVLAKGTKPEDLLKASLSIEHAIRLDRTNKYFYQTAASIYTSLGKFDKAAEAYESMIREVKGSDEYLFELAAIYQYGNNNSAAIKTYDRAEAIFGVNEISSVQKLRLYLEQNKTKEALAEADKLLSGFPDEERFVMGTAEVLSQKGLRAEAIAYLEKFLATHADALDASMLLAGLYRDNRQEEKARPLLSKLFDNPMVDASSKIIVLGAYNAELNNARTKGESDPDKAAFAISLFEKLLTVNAGQPGVHIIGGDLYLSLGQVREAQKEYLLATDEGEVSFEVWENLVFLEVRLEQYDQALKHAEEALELFPNQGMLHYFHGFASLRKRRYDEAVASLEQARRLSQNNPSLLAEINMLLGEAYHGKQDYPRSDKAFDDALEAKPDDATLLNNYSYYLALRKDHLDKAEKMSSTLVKNHPDNPTFLDTHAWVLYVREKYKDARRFIERAIATGKATASHFEHYGDILYKLGEVDSAVVQWEKARGLNAKSEILNKKIANRKIYE